MKFLVVYETTNKKNLKKFQEIMDIYEKTKRVSVSVWIINFNGDVLALNVYLTQLIDIDDSLLVLALNKEWAASNFLDVAEWLNEN